MDVEFEKYFLKKNSAKKRNMAWFKENIKYLGPDYELISGFMGTDRRVTFFHKACQKYWNPLARNVVYAHSHCPCCKSRAGLKHLKEYCENNGFTIVDEYINYMTVIRFKKNECNHIFKKSPSNLIHKNIHGRCPVCYRHFEKLDDDVKKMIQWRKDRNIPQIQLAEMLYVSTATISNMERGKRKLRPEEKQRLLYYMDSLTLRG